MQFIKDHSDVPVPRVLAYELDENNAVGVAFILIEVLPGSVAIDALGGYDVHRGVIPREHRQTFYRSVARQHVQLTSLRLPQIGSVARNHNGGYECGPLPGIGGPFDTAAAFFEAWADSVKFKSNNETITRMMQNGTAPISAEQMITIIENFPLQIKAMANRNIMVDDSFCVTGIIDWEGACTVPCELLAFPDFLTAMPVSFDLPQRYDQDGQPLDEELRERWRERGEYVEMVKSNEHKDSMLSDCLGYDLRV
ncbi:uncharacterized protein PGRI_075320 [Penicillium griseofulvum]|uniref:Aminoglycoside phosphotransferase n=1 Tax=Penicillium patulum TaxID=5078 RepID=A0A135LZJ2_PENPA|nr:uncharacterized protein PGRI_075320 [Penicillium griseofulvum]KXG54388.1 hypothetical protein PGRI_075320 [Penicillium griseofulvum]